MKFFIGSKIVLAIAMTRAAFVAYRYPDQPPNPDAGSPDDAGYLVEYTDGGAPNHPDHAGYISWCPKDQFESQNLLIGDVGHLPPHQQRVIAEREQLDDRIQKLEAFLQHRSLRQPARRRAAAAQDAGRCDGAVSGHHQHPHFEVRLTMGAVARYLVAGLAMALVLALWRLDHISTRLDTETKRADLLQEQAVAYDQALTVRDSIDTQYLEAISNAELSKPILVGELNAGVKRVFVRAACVPSQSQAHRQR